MSPLSDVTLSDVTVVELGIYRKLTCDTKVDAASRDTGTSSPMKHLLVCV